MSLERSTPAATNDNISAEVESRSQKCLLRARRSTDSPPMAHFLLDGGAGIVRRQGLNEPKRAIRIQFLLKLANRKCRGEYDQQPQAEQDGNQRQGRLRFHFADCKYANVRS